MYVIQQMFWVRNLNLTLAIESQNVSIEILAYSTFFQQVPSISSATDIGRHIVVGERPSRICRTRNLKVWSLNWRIWRCFRWTWKDVCFQQMFLVRNSNLTLLRTVLISSVRLINTAASVSELFITAPEFTSLWINFLHSSTVILLNPEESGRAKMAKMRNTKPLIGLTLFSQLVIAFRFFPWKHVCDSWLLL